MRETGRDRYRVSRGMRPTTSWSGAPSRYAQSIPIRILKIALAASKTLFVDGNPELCETTSMSLT
jgi:hypothetical protein